MSVIRIVKDSNYSVINNTILNDDRVSWEAKGMACYLLSKPDDWRINANHLWRVATNGHGAVKRILRELEEYGYLRRTRIRAADGTFEWESELHEVPQEPEPGSLAATQNSQPSDENRSMENRPTETIERFSSHIVNTIEQVLKASTEEEKRAAALPPAPPVTPPAPAPTSKTPTAAQSVAFALEGEPLPVGRAQTPLGLSKLPAVVAYRDVFLAYPPKAQMVQMQAHGIEDLERWRMVLGAWCRCGYNPRNIGGMLDWYDDPARMATPAAKGARLGAALSPPQSKVAASLQAVDDVFAMLEKAGGMD